METGLITVQDLRAFLEGAWNLTRSIEDRYSNESGRLVGRANFSGGGEDIRYEETGRLTTASFDDEVRQEYIYLFPESHRAAVKFRDGRDFHDLDLRTGIWEARHDCEPDVYDGAFSVKNSDLWQCQWTITGPRKDMTIRSIYSRDQTRCKDAISLNAR